VTSCLADTKTTQLDCRFYIDPLTNYYVCDIEGVTDADDESQSFSITGEHLANKTNMDVDIFHVINCSIPFVVSQAFYTFPQMQGYFAESSGLKRIQTNAIQNARKLRLFFASNNPDLTTVHAHAFAAGSFLEEVHLPFNSISEIHPNALVGLTNVWSLNFNVNKIKEIPKNLLRPLLRLRVFGIGSNLLKVLDGELFTYNPRMRQIYFSFNEINAIGGNFLKNLPFLDWIFIQRNPCIDVIFSVQMHPPETIHERFRPCFENYDKVE
jgi:Leucine-rich repeat (LRR) protein